MKRVHFHIVSVLFAVLLINSAPEGILAEDTAGDEHDAFRAIPEGMVHIINSINASIYFSLSYDGENWQEVNLEANQSEVFEFANYIKISTKLKTDTKIKSYRLEPSRRYQIVWNAQDNYYDVVKLSDE